ncbi:MAG: hypothetical protein P8Z77_04555, partial [Candidatus Thiodiazotropha sp.]
ERVQQACTIADASLQIAQPERTGSTTPTGGIGYGAGLLLSLWFDLPAGALIVCCLLVAVIPWLVKRERTVMDSC